MDSERSARRKSIRAARDWLMGAEDALAGQDDLAGDLKLMLARAELERASVFCRDGADGFCRHSWRWLLSWRQYHGSVPRRRRRILCRRRRWRKVRKTVPCMHQRNRRPLLQRNRLQWGAGRRWSRWTLPHRCVRSSLYRKPLLPQPCRRQHPLRLYGPHSRPPCLTAICSGSCRSAEKY